MCDKGAILTELNDLVRECFQIDEKASSLPLDRIEKALSGEDGPAILAAHGSGDSLLHTICYHPDITLDTVKWLIQLYPEAVCHKSERRGWLPLHRICLNPSIKIEIVEYLIDLYPGALQILWDGKTPLACLLNNFAKTFRLDLVKLLVNRAPETVRIRVEDYRGETTIVHLACEMRSVSKELLHVLLEHWPECSSITARGLLPLQVLLGSMRRSNEEPLPLELVSWLLDQHPPAIRAVSHERGTGGHALHLACRKGQSLEVIQLLGDAYPEAYRSVEGTNIGNLPLHEYCLSKKPNLETVRFLVEKYPESLSITNLYGFEPIQYASRASFEVVKYMLDQNPDLGRSPAVLQAVVKNGEMESLRYLVEQFPETVRRIRPVEGTILHAVARNSRENDPALRERLRYVFDLYPEAIDVPDRDGNLPVHSACYRFEGYSHGEAIEFFLAKQPRAAKVKTHNGSLALHLFYQGYWCNSNRKQDLAIKVAKRLLGAYPGAVKVVDDEGRLPLHHACDKGHDVKTIKHLVGLYRSSLQVVSPKHGLPIHLAVSSRHGDLAAIEYLIKQSNESLDSNIVGIGLPIHCASRSGSKDVFELLLGWKYNGSMKGNLVLHAILRDHELMDKATVAKRLLDEFPGHLSNRDSQGAAPLHVAVASDVGAETIDTLLDLDPEVVRLKDKSNSLPLHYALRNGDPSDVVGALLTRYPYGAQIAGANGFLPIHCASRQGAPLEVVQRLVEIYPEGIVIADNLGEYPIHKACRAGHRDLVKYLADQDPSSVRHSNREGVLPALLLCQSAGKQDYLSDELAELGTIWKLLRMHPEAVLIP